MKLNVVIASILWSTTACSQFSLGDTAVSMGEEYLTLRPVISVTSVRPGETVEAGLEVTTSPLWHINSAKPHQDWLIPTKLALDTLASVTPHALEYPLGRDRSLMGEKMSVYDGAVLIRFKVTVDQKATAGEYFLPLHFSFQPCNDKECRAPQSVETKLLIDVGEAGTPINPDLFDYEPKQANIPDRSSSTPTTENDLQRLINKYGFWGYFIALGVAFLTGVLLSFSPCTYPMVPITVSIFAGQQRSVGRGFMLSLLYVGSMAIVYGIMGLIVSLVGGVFGAWLASPPVVIGIAIVFVVFSLSMFGLYELQVPGWLRQKLGTRAKGGGVASTVLLGIIAALVVSPCVGPFVASILLYVASKGSPLIGFLVLFVFALGLGTLYVIIGTFSSAINALPGSGMWMESIKKFFGFVLLLMAIYFLQTVISPSLIAILTGLVLVAFGVFGGGLDRLTPELGFFPRLKKFLGVLAFLVGIYLLLGVLMTQGYILPPASEWLTISSEERSTEKSELIAWETDLDAGLTKARSEGKPVLIDTWATWCANCRVLEKKTFHDPSFAEEAKRFVPIKVQLENSSSEITKNFMSRFGLKQYSLPTTLLLDSKGSVRRILPGVVKPEEMIAEMRKI